MLFVFGFVFGSFDENLFMEQKLNGFEETGIKNVSGKKIKITNVSIDNEDVGNFNLKYVIKKIKPIKGQENIDSKSKTFVLSTFVSNMQINNSSVEITDNNSVFVPNDCKLFLSLEPIFSSNISSIGNNNVIYQFI